MRLRSLRIANFGCIDDTGVEVVIDKIVVLIGPNNVGKSTVLDAYEAFASTGAPLEISMFPNRCAERPVAVEGVFTDLTEEDMSVLGAKWKHADATHGECVRCRWVWSKPEEKGKKQSWDPANSDWVDGGMGGWDTLLVSRIPVPLRVRSTDDAEATESQITEILTSAVKATLKNDHSRTESVLKELKKLTEDLAKEVETQIAEATSGIGQRLSAVFPGYQVEFHPELGKFEPEKSLGAGSYIQVRREGADMSPLKKQGAGFRRTFLWSALGTLADIGRIRQGKGFLPTERQRILLIEEPESFLHPPMIRAAREALYGLAEVAEWQVIATTHSPVFIDVAKPHTTIVRLARDGGVRTQLFQTDRAQFSDQDRDNLRMVRSCHPTVAEFFFADHVILVEGETEQAVLAELLAKVEDPAARAVTVLNCMGKANIPLFQRILNQFSSTYTVVHDSDSPRAKRKDRWQRNPMWTINEQIFAAVSERKDSLGVCHVVSHVPGFEQHYFGTTASADKPYQAIQVLRRPDFGQTDDTAALAAMASQLLAGNHPCATSSMGNLVTRVRAWSTANQPSPKEAWDVEDVAANGEFTAEGECEAEPLHESEPPVEASQQPEDRREPETDRTMNHIKSKQRVADHGEVFTPAWMVEAMLDLVKEETERIDSRFLEPACGSGNFLVKILRRKLAAVELKYGKNDFERRHYALLALMCIYGIELLPDNISECRTNLLEIFSEYLNLDESDELYRAAFNVLSENLVHGDALKMLTHDGRPIAFAEWGYLGKGQYQRRDFRLQSLAQSAAFSAKDSVLARLGRHQLFKPVKSYAPMTVSELAAAGEAPKEGK